VNTLCDFAAEIPDLVGTFLDRETKLKQGRFDDGLNRG